MIYWLIAALVAALGGLAAARYLDTPAWLDALFATGGAVGLALALALGIGLRRLLGERWNAVAALAVAVASALGRASLLAHLVLEPGASREVSFPVLALACSTVVWGVLALLWGTLAISDGFSNGRGWGWRLAAMAAVALALYSLAPLWYVLGITVNHWTVLGLFGLACAAWGIGRLYRALGSRLGQFF